jgi:thiamine-phosphate pyrophosphorylase
MKLAVISPTAADAREPAALAALLNAGLERYHVRKPDWSPAETEAWLAALPVACRSRLVLHGGGDLAARLGLGGRHWRDNATTPIAPPPGGGFASRSCHDLTTLRAVLGHWDAVFFGPVFASISKPGHGPRGDWDFDELAALLAARTPYQRRTAVFALGGITAENAAQCRELGFDGVAVLGTIWQAPDPVAAFIRLQSALRLPPIVSRKSKIENTVRSFPVMAITQDGLDLAHEEQAALLCAAGARWIQLRLKGAAPAAWLATAQAVVAICRRHGAICIVNDSVEVALAAGADGVHLGRLDGDWNEARRRLGPDRLIGGTVNDASDAARARASGALDYVGVGPLRFTSTKRNLSPVLGPTGLAALLAGLGDLPAWVIGGVEPGDLPGLRADGATGVAVSSGLLRDEKVAENLRSYLAAWGATAFSASGIRKSYIVNRKSPSAA